MDSRFEVKANFHYNENGTLSYEIIVLEKGNSKNCLIMTEHEAKQLCKTLDIILENFSPKYNGPGD